jgi:hypothetical protein
LSSMYAREVGIEEILDAVTGKLIVIEPVTDEVVPSVSKHDTNTSLFTLVKNETLVPLPRVYPVKVGVNAVAASPMPFN